MKITKIEIVENKKPIPLSESWRPAWNEPDTPDIKTMGFSFYKVHTDEGITGIGPCPISPGISHLAQATLIGQDPFYIQRFWEINMKGRETVLGNISSGGIEIALWDIIGKATNKPVYKLLGAYRDKVMAYAATSQLKTAEECAKMALDFKNKGIKAIKLRLHRPNPEDDLDVVRAVKDAVKNDMYILVDANQNNISINYKYWDIRTAKRVARELQDMGVYYLEEPLPRSDLKGLAELASDLDMYIAGGEHCSNVYEFRDALFAGAYDIVQPDVILGNIGISGIIKVSIIADALGKLIVPHVCGGGNNGLYLSATLQALGAISNCPFIEYTLDPPSLVPEVLHLILKEPILIDEDGYVRIPDKPGIGVELNEDAIAEYI